MSGNAKSAVTKKRGSSTSSKSNRKIADKAQFQRFVETAKKIGMDEDPEALDRAFDKILPPKAP